jgi:molybdopterin molybdotransferase
VPLALPGVLDEPERLRAALADAISRADLVLISGGSSVGARDGTLDALLSFPNSELLLHGIAIRPGKPVIAARIDSKLLVGLPGNPVSALVVFDQFVRPHLRRLGGEAVTGRQLPSDIPPDRSSSFEHPTLQPLLPASPTVDAVLLANVSSDTGKEDFIRVRLCFDGDQYLAEPVLGKSALIATMVEADGMVIIPEGVEGLEAGTQVRVVLF